MVDACEISTFVAYPLNPCWNDANLSFHPSTQTKGCSPKKTNMTMQNSIHLNMHVLLKHGEFSSHVSELRGKTTLLLSLLLPFSRLGQLGRTHSLRKPLETESIFSHVTPQVKSLVLQLLEPDQDVVWCWILKKKRVLGGGFKHFLFSPLFGEDFQFD